VEKELGKGCFGAVSLVKHKSNGAAYAMKHLALKSINGPFMVNLYLALREIELMKKLDHPHVIKLYEVFRGDEDLYLVMELCSGGELQEKLEAMPGMPTPAPFPESVSRFPEEQTKVLARDILSAIAYLHTNGIVHRDLKLENVMFAGDFGFL
jgi:calcium-dependent protein kinase